MPPRGKSRAKRKRVSIPAQIAPPPVTKPRQENKSAPNSFPPAAATYQQTSQQRPNDSDSGSNSISPAENSAETTAQLKERALALLKVALGDKFNHEISGKALDAVQENNPQTAADAWANEAMIELALQQETHEESKKMGLAMEQSLLEAEEKKKQEVPIQQRTGTEVIHEFRDSELLTSLLSKFDDTKICRILDNTLLQKPHFVEYVLLERRCKRWYSCSRGYFAKVAKSIVDEMLLFIRRNNNDNGDPAIAPTNNRGEEKEEEDDDLGMAVLLDGFVENQVLQLREEIYARPEDGNEAAIPALFAEIAPPEPEELVLIED